MDWTLIIPLGTGAATLVFLVSKGLRDEAGGWAETVRKIRTPPPPVEKLEQTGALEAFQEQSETLHAQARLLQGMYARVEKLEAHLAARDGRIEDLEDRVAARDQRIEGLESLLTAWADWSEEAQELIAGAGFTLRPAPPRKGSE